MKLRPSPDANASGQFLHNLILFGRLLRGLGMDVNPGRMIDLVHALDYITVGRKSDFYHAARGLLVHNREDIPLFDEAFEMFWRTPVEEWKPLVNGTTLRKRPSRPQTVPPPLRQPKNDALQNKNGEGADTDQPPVIEVTLTYSWRELLRERDFAELSGEELEAVKQMMGQLALQLGERRTRRRRPGKGRWPDFRRTMRHSFKYGGEILYWARREPKFNTRQLARRDVDQALYEVSLVVRDWSGGTRLGESLKAFNFVWGRRVLGRGAVVLLISDGWDRGDIDLLQHEIARLQRSCQRLIWLNPLLGSPEYEPLTRGMQAALPYIDDFLPVHNLASLEDLAEHLSRLTVRARPNVRKQRAVMYRPSS
jgi:uncharacterized protein with von Willebrand factor type A (vWA) domain